MNIILSTKDIALLVTLFIVSVLLLIFAIYFFKVRDKNIKLSSKLKELIYSNRDFKEQLIENKTEIATLKQRLENYSLLEEKYNNILQSSLKDKEQIEHLKTKLTQEQKSFNEKLNLLKSQEEQLKVSFKNLANEILYTTKEKLQQESKDSIESLIKPLSTQLSDFKVKIEYLNKEEAKELSALQNELKNLKELSFKLSNEAQNLTNALKGDNKQQGIWGEIVLSRVLELSGLREGVEYKKEVVLKDISNQTYRPDVVVYLPNNREVIIDAKTSLVAYKKFIEAHDDYKSGFLKAHIASVKRHIDNLSEKKYENLKGINSLDFIFIFMPIENALMTALQADSSLFEYAFKRRVVLVSPTTLLVSLRAIESSWRYERQAKNIAEVIKNAETLYDKVRGFLEDFSKVGKSLDSAKNSYDSAKLKLTSGKGNLLRQIEMLKEKADIKPKKEIPQEFIN